MTRGGALVDRADSSEPQPLHGQERSAEQGGRGRPRRRGRGRSTRLLTGSSVAPVHDSAWEQRHWTSRVLHRLGDIAARSTAGVLAALFVVAWAVVGLALGYPSWWLTVLYSVTGSVTFVMVFVIQHTQERQTLATQRKLDELIRSSDSADDALIAVEEAGDEMLHALNHRDLADRAAAAGEA